MVFEVVPERQLAQRWSDPPDFQYFRRDWWATVVEPHVQLVHPTMPAIVGSKCGRLVFAFSDAARACP